MSSKREQMAAKAARLAQRTQDGASSPESDRTALEAERPPESPARARRTHPVKVTEQSGMVRTTVDLAPAMHRELRALLADVAADLGRSRVTASDAHRVLVRRLLSDPDTRDQFLADCRDQL